MVEVGTPVTHVGDEEGVAPVADAKPRVVIEDEEIPFTTITRETDALPKGETRVVTEGVKGPSHIHQVNQLLLHRNDQEDYRRNNRMREDC